MLEWSSGEHQISHIHLCLLDCARPIQKAKCRNSHIVEEGMWVPLPLCKQQQ